MIPSHNTCNGTVVQLTLFMLLLAAVPPTTHAAPNAASRQVFVQVSTTSELQSHLTELLAAQRPGAALTVVVQPTTSARSINVTTAVVVNVSQLAGPLELVGGLDAVRPLPRFACTPQYMGSTFKVISSLHPVVLSGFHLDPCGGGGADEPVILVDGAQSVALHDIICEGPLRRQVAYDSVMTIGGLLSVKDTERVSLLRCRVSNLMAAQGAGIAAMQVKELVIEESDFGHLEVNCALQSWWVHFHNKLGRVCGNALCHCRLIRCRLWLWNVR